MNNAVVGYHRFVQRRIEVMKNAVAPEGLAEVLDHIDKRICDSGICRLTLVYNDKVTRPANGVSFIADYDKCCNLYSYLRKLGYSITTQYRTEYFTELSVAPDHNLLNTMLMYTDLKSFYNTL